MVYWALALHMLWVDLGDSGGVLWRVPHWQLVKLKRHTLCCGDFGLLCCCKALNPKP